MRRPRISLVVLGLSLFALSVQAQQRTESERAVDLGHEALKAYDQHEWSKAVTLLRQADRLSHSPVFTLYLGRAERNRGRLLAARELYQRLLSEPRADGEPEPWSHARQSAAAELKALEQRIPRLRLLLRKAAGAEVSIRVDGVHVSEEQARALALDPGAHRLVVSAGKKTLRHRLNLAEGSGVNVLRLDLSGKPLPRSRPIQPSAETRGPPTASWVAFGASGVALAFGGVTGVRAWALRDDIKQRCDGNSCRETDSDEGDNASKFARLSTVGFTVAAVTAAAGIVIWLTDQQQPRRVGLGTDGSQLLLRGRL